MDYQWIKALHVIAVLAWMAGMLYLPRLYVYHADVPVGSDQDKLFQVMERRLLRLILNPAMIVAWLCGAWLLWHNPDMLKQGWMHVKLAMLLGMQLMHACFARWRRGFVSGQNRHSAKFYRWMNEAPTVLMIVIVIMVIVKPF